MLPKAQVLSRCQLSINQSSFGCVLLKYFGEQTCTKMGHFLAGELDDKFKETKMIWKMRVWLSAYAEQKCPWTFPEMDFSPNHMIIFIAKTSVY